MGENTSVTTSPLAYLHAAAAAPLFWLALRLCGPARTMAFARRPHTNMRDGVNAREARALAGVVNAAVTRALGPRQCLTRSLVLQWLLARRGMASCLRIGVRREGPRLLAHAWIELGGSPINDSPQVTRDYAAFDGPLPLAAFSAEATRP
jgi:hypothetical protein